MNLRFIIAMFICSVTLFSETLTLEDAINKSLAFHPDIKSLELRVEQSHAAYKSVFADYLPQINLSANYNALQTFVFPQNGTFHTIDDSGWNAGVALKQKIWDFSKTSSKVQATNIDKNIAVTSLKDIKALLVFKVKSLYELMIVQSEAIEVRKQDLKTKEAYYAQAMALVNQGLKTDADASRFLSAVYIARDALTIAESSYEKAKNTLSLYMGEKISDRVELEKEQLQKRTKCAQEDEREILKHNYQLQIFSQNIEKNILLHKSAKASHYGSVDAQASYAHIDTLNAYDAKLLGVSLNIPLYSGGRVSAETQKAKIATQIAKEQKSSKELALKEEIESLFIDIKRYENTIKAKKAQQEAAVKTLHVLDGRYKEGLSTYIEVLDATSLVLNAKLGLLEAYYAKSMACNRLEYLKGMRDE